MAHPSKERERERERERELRQRTGHEAFCHRAFAGSRLTSTDQWQVMSELKRTCYKPWSVALGSRQHPGRQLERFHVSAVANTRPSTLNPLAWELKTDRKKRAGPVMNSRQTTQHCRGLGVESPSERERDT